MKRMTASGAGIALLGCVVLNAGNALADSTYAEDRAEIENLQAHYMFALDFGDGEAYAATFTEDGVLDYGAGKIVGREAIAAVAGGRRSGDDENAPDESGLWAPMSRHNITNIVIEIDGDTATGTAYWFNYGNDNPERAPQLSSYGHYEDELRRVDGKWLFSLRKIYNEQVGAWVGGRENPVVHPGPGPGAQD